MCGAIYIYAYTWYSMCKNMHLYSTSMVQMKRYNAKYCSILHSANFKELHFAKSFINHNLLKTIIIQYMLYMTEVHLCNIILYMLYMSEVHLYNSIHYITKAFSISLTQMKHISFICLSLIMLFANIFFFFINPTQTVVSSTPNWPELSANGVIVHRLLE